MITSFEVGAIFKIVDQASPALRKILDEVKLLTQSIDKARASLASLSKTTLPGLTTSINETRSLARAWGRVAKNADAAAIAIGKAAGVATRMAALPAIPGPPAPNRFRPAAGGHSAGRGRSGSGFHVSGFSAPLGGGMHGRVSNHSGMGGNLALGAAGALIYSGIVEGKFEDAAQDYIYHTGIENSPENIDKLRKVFQDFTSYSGASLNDTKEAALVAARQFRDTPAGGANLIGSLPTYLKGAVSELRAKGKGNLPESMDAIVGIAHALKLYTPEQIESILPDLAYISASNPDSLKGIERSLSYSLGPLTALGYNAGSVMEAGTALRRAGATSSKSGTWLRELGERALPGSKKFDKPKDYAAHQHLLREAGLVNKQGKPTWYTDGKPDMMKLLDALSDPRITHMPAHDLNALRNHLFGKRGGAAASLLGNKEVHGILHEMNEGRLSPENRNRYRSFMDTLNQKSPVQQFHVAVADFNNVMMDIGKTTLPPLTSALREFDKVLRNIRGILPEGKGGEESHNIGKRAIEGALVGAAAGAFMGGIGAVPGALLGGAVGGAYGLTEDMLSGGYKSPGQVFPGGTSRDVWGAPPSAKAPPVVLNLSIDLDSQALARASAKSAEFPVGAGAPDALGTFHSPGDSIF